MTIQETPSPALPEGVSRVEISQTSVLIQASQKLAETGLALKFGDGEVRLMPAGDSGGDLPDLREFRPDLSGGGLAGADMPAGAELTLSTNRQWSLPDLPTLQLKIAPGLPAMQAALAFAPANAAAIPAE